MLHFPQHLEPSLSLVLTMASSEVNDGTQTFLTLNFCLSLGSPILRTCMKKTDNMITLWYYVVRATS